VNITMKGVTNRSGDYRGFVISWQEPPLTGAKWTANVASNSPQLYALMGSGGATVIDGRTREEMLTNAKSYIDRLFR
jgi:hypothetical protein